MTSIGRLGWNSLEHRIEPIDETDSTVGKSGHSCDWAKFRVVSAVTVKRCIFDTGKDEG